ncbi:hypothetical protein GA0116948_105185 [Chitinophaga costaii]|uniref:WG containing repeat-containing protein n=1 Tax=Chitinophaga costaii TaxID=1335309 RepID=A0A1C4DBF6_9BACT|nr:hypothetical protein [Chitinophaga costaii]PUZ24550.1 hypothetical protein DCM91_11685 [Chitinophaga costaii]SCC28715.1 hypothetical protein GA0116948_105185 [Chitinophaga costaii]
MKAFLFSLLTLCGCGGAFAQDSLLNQQSFKLLDNGDIREDNQFNTDNAYAFAVAANWDDSLHQLVVGILKHKKEGLNLPMGDLDKKLLVKYLDANLNLISEKEWPLGNMGGFKYNNEKWFLLLKGHVPQLFKEQKWDTLVNRKIEPRADSFVYTAYDVNFSLGGMLHGKTPEGIALQHKLELDSLPKGLHKSPGCDSAVIAPDGTLTQVFSLPAPEDKYGVYKNFYFVKVDRSGHVLRTDSVRYGVNRQPSLPTFVYDEHAKYRGLLYVFGRLQDVKEKYQDSVKKRYNIVFVNDSGRVAFKSSFEAGLFEKKAEYPFVFNTAVFFQEQLKVLGYLNLPDSTGLAVLNFDTSGVFQGSGGFLPMEELQSKLGEDSTADKTALMHCRVVYFSSDSTDANKNNCLLRFYHLFPAHKSTPEHVEYAGYGVMRLSDRKAQFVKYLPLIKGVTDPGSLEMIKPFREKLMFTNAVSRQSALLNKDLSGLLLLQDPTDFHPQYGPVLRMNPENNCMYAFSMKKNVLVIKTIKL